MARFHLYMVSCVLLLLLSLHYRTSSALPLPDSSANGAQCAALFKSLINLTTLLQLGELCPEQIRSTEVTIPSAKTVQACTPTQNSSCMVQRDSSFSESECRRRITKDLAYYDDAIQSYLKPPLHRQDKEENVLSPVLEVIQKLRKDCSTTVSGEKDSTEEGANMWEGDTFMKRQKMCKIMMGFHIRTITINRAMGYISSGDHRK